jgi:hypothetical protein
MSAELAVVYAALILEDDNVEITVSIGWMTNFYVVWS